MPAWLSPAELSRDVAAALALLWVSVGIAAYDHARAARFDAQLLAGRRARRWPHVLYFGAKLSWWAYILLTVSFMYAATPVDCGALLVGIEALMGVLTVCSSGLLGVRAYCVLRSSLSTATARRATAAALVLCTLGLAAAWGLGAADVPARWAPGAGPAWAQDAGACTFGPVPRRYAAKYVATTAYDALVLALTLAGVARLRVRVRTAGASSASGAGSRLSALLVEHGAAYFVSTLAANALVAGLCLADLSPVMALIAAVPAACVTQLAATRLYVDLARQAAPVHRLERREAGDNGNDKEKDKDAALHLPIHHNHARPSAGTPGSSGSAPLGAGAGTGCSGCSGCTAAAAAQVFGHALGGGGGGADDSARHATSSAQRFEDMFGKTFANEGSFVVPLPRPPSPEHAVIALDHACAHCAHAHQHVQHAYVHALPYAPHTPHQHGGQQPRTSAMRSTGSAGSAGSSDSAGSSGSDATRVASTSASVSASSRAKAPSPPRTPPPQRSAPASPSGSVRSAASPASAASNAQPNRRSPAAPVAARFERADAAAAAARAQALAHAHHGQAPHAPPQQQPQPHPLQQQQPHPLQQQAPVLGAAHGGVRIAQDRVVVVSGGPSPSADAHAHAHGGAHGGAHYDGAQGELVHIIGPAGSGASTQAQRVAQAFPTLSAQAAQQAQGQDLEQQAQHNEDHQQRGAAARVRGALMRAVSHS